MYIKSVKMKICPRCGSKNVDWIIPQNWSVWECKDCDYTGPIIEGDETIAEEIKKDYDLKMKKKKIHAKKREEKIKEKREEYKEHEKEDYEEELSDEEIEKRLNSLDI
jgi:hypothetical protein